MKILRLQLKGHWCWHKEHSLQENLGNQDFLHRREIKTQVRGEQRSGNKRQRVGDSQLQGHHLQPPGQGQSRGDTGYDRTPPSMGDALPPARSQVSYQLCRGDPLPSACVMRQRENSYFPGSPGVWKIQKEGGSRLKESMSQDERMPQREMQLVASAGEKMRTNYVFL